MSSEARTPQVPAGANADENGSTASIHRAGAGGKSWEAAITEALTERGFEVRRVDSGFVVVRNGLFKHIPNRQALANFAQRVGP